MLASPETSLNVRSESVSWARTRFKTSYSARESFFPRPSVRARRQLASIWDIRDIKDGVSYTVMGSKVTGRFSGRCKRCLKLKITKITKKPWAVGYVCIPNSGLWGTRGVRRAGSESVKIQLWTYSYCQNSYISFDTCINWAFRISCFLRFFVIEAWKMS